MTKLAIIASTILICSVLAISSAFIIAARSERNDATGRPTTSIDVQKLTRDADNRKLPEFHYKMD